MGVKKGASNGQEIRVSGVLNLDDAPWVLPSPNSTATMFQDVLRPDNRKRHQAPKLGIFLHSVLVVLFNVVGEVIDRNAVMFNVFHDQFLRFGKFSGGEGIRLANDGNDIDAGREALHELNVELSEAMTRRSDKVEESMDTVVSESWVALDARFFRQDVVVLALKIANNFSKGGFVVNLVAEAGSIDNGQRYASPLLIQLEF